MRARSIGLTIAIVAAVGALVAGVLVQRGSGSDSALRLALEDEFEAASPAAPTSSGEIVEVSLTAAPAVLDLIEGARTDVWAYNGIVPGPALRVALGATLRVELQNSLPFATTIHWHGVRVPNAMDGVPGVTQQPVAPGASFVYEFTPPDAGTFWYHSHTDGSEQLDRGLYGSLVVDDVVASAYDQDVVWVIDDWLLTAEGQVDPAFDIDVDVEHNGRWGDLVTANASTAEIIEAHPGERIRLRLINASNGRVYAPRFNGLDASLIAVDGLAARTTLVADGFELAPGNRIDVDIVVPASEGTYAITDDFTGDVYSLGSIVATGEGVSPGAFSPPVNPGLPVWLDAADVAVDHDYRLNIRRGAAAWEWTFDDRAYPDVEALHVELGRLTKIRLTNESQLLHPIHMHGLFFKVVSRNGAPVDEGHFRDTVLVHPGEVVEVAMIAFDEGTWAVHCHIQEHAAAGMMTLIEVTR